MQPQPNFPKGTSPAAPVPPGRFPLVNPVEYPGAQFLPNINETAEPMTGPVGGGFLYCVGGALMFRNATGETQLVAGP